MNNFTPAYRKQLAEALSREVTIETWDNGAQYAIMEADDYNDLKEAAATLKALIDGTHETHWLAPNELTPEIKQASSMTAGCECGAIDDVQLDQKNWKAMRAQVKK